MKNNSIIQTGMCTFFLAVFVFVFTITAEAQYMSVGANAYVGGGAYFGMAGCPGGVKIPKAIKRIEDEVKMIERLMRENEREIKKFEDETAEKKKKYDEKAAAITGWLKPHVGKAVVNQLRAPTGSVEDPEMICGDNGQIKKEIGGVLPWMGFCKRESRPATNSSEKPQMVHQYSDEATQWKNFSTPAGVDPQICSQAATFIAPRNVNSQREAERYANRGIDLRGRLSGAEKCSDAVETLTELFDDFENHRLTLAALKEKQTEYESKLRGLDNKRDYELDKWKDDMAEGRPCIDCMFGTNAPEVTTKDRVVGVLGALVGGAASLYGVRMVNRANTEMGWPSSPWMTAAAVAPWAVAGLYGAAYGGVGGIGCTPGAGGSAFGYPPGMYNPYAGGAFMPGVFPAAGGFPAMGFPGFAVGAIGQVGAMAPYAGFPYAGMPYAGAPFVGAIGQVGAIAPYAGMPYAGVPYAGMPYAGAPFVGAIGQVGAMAPYAGVPYAGMPYAGGMMAPFVGAIGQVGAMAPMAAFQAYAPMAGSNMAMQYQMQMQMQYQQQMQAWLVEQQRMQQDAMQRGQIISRLQQQLVMIQTQIQQISYGAYGSSYLGVGGGIGTGYLGVPLVPTGNVTTPDGSARGRGYLIPGN